MNHHNRISESKSQGTYVLYKNSEGLAIERATVGIGCDIFGCHQSVTFSRPSEPLLRSTYGISVPYGTTSGVFIISPNNPQGAAARFSLGRDHNNGEGMFWGIYHAHSGTIVINSADEQTQHMMGSFNFLVDVEGLIQKVEGEFDLSS